MKKYSLFLLIIIIIWNITGCSDAKRTFGSSQYNKSYQEKLTAFYTQSNKKKIILIGKKHNYAFNNAKKLSQLLEQQKLLDLKPSNISLTLRIKEYKSSVVSLTLFSHFEKSKLNAKQIKGLESNGFALEERANLGGKKSEPKPPKVPTYVLLLELQGERQKSKDYKQSEVLSPIISLEVSEHISR